FEPAARRLAFGSQVQHLPQAARAPRTRATDEGEPAPERSLGCESAAQGVRQGTLDQHRWATRRVIDQGAVDIGDRDPPWDGVVVGIPPPRAMDDDAVWLRSLELRH